MHLEEVVGTGCTILLLSLPGCPVQVKGRAEQTAFPALPNGLSHCSGSVEGRAPATESAELTAEYRILFCASCLWSGLVWPRSHLNRWKESVFALARGLPWRPQRSLQTRWSGRAAKTEERRLRFEEEINKSSRTFPADVDYEICKWPLGSHLEKWKLQET